MKLLFSKENKIVGLITIIWSTISLICGSIMIQRYYETGLKNQYNMQLNMVGQMFWLVIAYLIAILFVNRIILFVVRAILHSDKERRILLFAIPFLLIFSIAFFTKYYTLVSHGQSYNYFDLPDERNIWDAAVRLYPFFFVYTSEVFLICFFIIPVAIAPAIVKPIFDAIILGYIIYRIKDRYNTKLAYLIYLLLAFFVADFSICTRVHRMYWYAFLYLLYATKLYFDNQINKINVNWNEITIMIFIISILSVWRREGIYFLVFGAIEVIYVYVLKTELENKRKILFKTIVLFALIEILVYIPVIINGYNEKMTTYEAFFVHIMGEESLKRDIISEELEIADGYIDIEKVDKYNKDFGMHAYDDCMYAWEKWEDGSYYAIRKNKTTNSVNFSSAVVSIILKEPIVFVKSRLRAFEASSGAACYNLYIPLCCLIIVLIYSTYKRYLILFILSTGVLVHTAVTTLTMPASYFKYFYEMFLFSYVFFVIIVIDFLKNKAMLCKRNISL